MDGKTPDDIQRDMALVGYSTAFDRAMEMIAYSVGEEVISESAIFDLYEALFSPSVDAGIVEPGLLRGWRKRPAFIMNSQHVPPPDSKVPRLMAQSVELINEIRGDAITRAVFTHLDFVTIHPFPDGNGRLSRFLMNIVLCSAGLPWITIRADDRDRYFNALELAHTQQNPGPFTDLITMYVDEAAQRLLAP